LNADIRSLPLAVLHRAWNGEYLIYFSMIGSELTVALRI
jgi:hypothetical protein